MEIILQSFRICIFFLHRSYLSPDRLKLNIVFRMMLFIVLMVCFSPNAIAQKYWSTAIDTTWGEGLPTADKLQIFDLFWNKIDDDYAGFHNLDINWDSLRTVYRPEIAAGVSRGRFSAIMDQLFMALMETHTHIFDVDVRGTSLEPGVPLLVYLSAYYFLDNGHFGVGLTPLPGQYCACLQSN